MGMGSWGWSRRDAEAAWRRLGRERAGRSWPCVWAETGGLARRGAAVLSREAAREAGGEVLRFSREAEGRTVLGTGSRDMGRGMPLGRGGGRSSMVSSSKVGFETWRLHDGMRTRLRQLWAKRICSGARIALGTKHSELCL